MSEGPKKPAWLINILTLLTALGAASGTILGFLEQRETRQGAKTEIARSEVLVVELIKAYVAPLKVEVDDLKERVAQCEGEGAGPTEAAAEESEEEEELELSEPMPEHDEDLDRVLKRFKPKQNDPRVQKALKGYSW